MSSLSRISPRFFYVITTLLFVGLISACSEDDDTGATTGGTSQNTTQAACVADSTTFVNDSLSLVNAWDGARMYDKWWEEAGLPEPTSSNPLATSLGTNSFGSEGWRCKECHGWNYEGSNGSPGILNAANKSPVNVFCAIKSATGLNNPAHQFGQANTTLGFNGGMSDQNMLALAKFITDKNDNGALDTSNFMNVSGVSTGDSAQGSNVYLAKANCDSCHGTDGTSPAGTFFTASLGSIADMDPAEFIHKSRFGQPGTIMPSFVKDNLGASELSNADIRNLLAYAQQILPTSSAGNGNGNGNGSGNTGTCSTDMATYVNNNYNSTSFTAWDGGQLYDKWWNAIPNASVSTRDHPMWATRNANTNNTTSGANTWRCKECHGWDYKGNDVGGQYATPGSRHYTGFRGILNNRTVTSPIGVFCAIRDGEGIDTRHKFYAGNTNNALTDNQVLRLTKFILVTGQNGLTESTQYISNNGNTLGNSTNGANVYNSTASCGTSGCHGPNGTFVNHGLTSLGDLTKENPWEVLHKIRYGHPGSIMPAFIDDNLGSQELSQAEIRDVLAYAQTLPAANPGGNTQSACIADNVNTINARLQNVNAWDGGRLFDNWFTEIPTTTPGGNHPLWSTQSSNTQLTGPNTWRCQECHGWDYKGRDGQYGFGSPSFTGFPGILNARFKQPVEIFCAIKDGYGIDSRHRFNGTNLSDSDIDKLTKFIVTSGDNGLTDSSQFIDDNTGLALGDRNRGETVYLTTADCDTCHGVNGDTSAGSTSSLGQLASENPWQVLHKIRYGHPGYYPEMPAFIEDTLRNELSVNEIKDVLTHLQTLPGSGGNGIGNGNGGVDLTPEECRIQKRSYVDAGINSESASQGGALYDKWWAALGFNSGPNQDHPVWADADPSATAFGQDTWRCKECHGWDYRGRDGAYGLSSTSSHFTDFRGVNGATNDAAIDVFCAIYSGTNRSPNHKFNGSNSRLTDQAILQMTKFITDSNRGVFDMRQYINLDPQASVNIGAVLNANISNGGAEFNQRCSSCHGNDGTLNSGSTSLGRLADDNPWEVLHKIRNGHPGSSPRMPSFVDENLSLNRMRDIVGYMQDSLISTNTGTGGGSNPVTGVDLLVMGALLYDNWIVQKGVDTPRNDNPVWALQSTNGRTGADTWRCKECHGWDYKGKDGNYSFSSSHYTGFDGVLQVNGFPGKSENELIDFITNGFTVQNDRMHDFGNYMNSNEIRALAAFIKSEVVDTSQYIREPGGTALGNASNGAYLYTFTDFLSNKGNCSLCHGLDGREINFGSSRNPEYLGDLAEMNPWEVLHKARFGSPGSIMPSMLKGGLDINDTADILTHTQTLPVVDD